MAFQVIIPTIGAAMSKRRRWSHVSRSFRAMRPKEKKEEKAPQGRRAARRRRANGANTTTNNEAPFPTNIAGPPHLASRRITVSADGSEGTIGENWWSARGKQVYDIALRRGKEDPVLETLRLGASYFDWTQSPLPEGAQKVYDQVKALAEGGGEPEEVVAKSQEPAPKKRTRRARRGGKAKTSEEIEAARVAKNTKARERRAAKKAAAGETDAQTDAETEAAPPASANAPVVPIGSAAKPSEDAITSEKVSGTESGAGASA